MVDRRLSSNVLKPVGAYSQSGRRWCCTLASDDANAQLTQSIEAATLAVPASEMNTNHRRVLVGVPDATHVRTKDGIEASGPVGLN